MTEKIAWASGVANNFWVKASYRPDGAQLTWDASSSAMNYQGDASGNDRLVSFSYDSAGRPVSGNYNGTALWLAISGGNPNGAYDALGRLREARRDACGIDETSSYDPVSNLPASSTLGFTGAAAPWYLAAFGYKDAGGILSSKLRWLSENASGSNYTYTYDGDGRLSTAAATQVIPIPFGTLGQTFSESYGFQLAGGGSLWNLQTVGSAKLPGGQDVYSYQPSPNLAPEQTEALQGIGAVKASYRPDGAQLTWDATSSAMNYQGDASGNDRVTKACKELSAEFVN